MRLVGEKICRSHFFDYFSKTVLFTISLWLPIRRQ
nr:MAG TPA_asm: hypothetical protein [Caudoviricetes sp.]